MRQTSLEAYWSMDNVKLNRRQQEVLEALKSIQPATNRMISEHANIPINVVTPRVGELVKKGVVMESYVNFDINGRKAIYWTTKREAYGWGD